jgi:hypothetical protein
MRNQRPVRRSPKLEGHRGRSVVELQRILAVTRAARRLRLQRCVEQCRNDLVGEGWSMLWQARNGVGLLDGREWRIISLTIGPSGARKKDTHWRSSKEIGSAEEADTEPGTAIRSGRKPGAEGSRCRNRNSSLQLRPRGPFGKEVRRHLI